MTQTSTRDESMGAKSVDSVVAEIKADVSWCGDRPKEVKEVLMTENLLRSTVGIRNDVAWHERRAEPVLDQSRLVIEEPAKFVVLGKPKGTHRPEGENEVRFDYYHKALFDERQIRSAWNEKLGEVKVVDYREPRLTEGKLTNLELIIVYSLNDFAEERKACSAVRQEMDRRVIARGLSEMAQNPAQQEGMSIEEMLADAKKPRAVKETDARILRPEEDVISAPAEKRPGTLTEAQRGSQINFRSPIMGTTLRFGSGSATEDGVSKIQITDAPGVLSRDAFELVFSPDFGSLMDVVRLTDNNEIRVTAPDPENKFQTQTVGLNGKGAGLPSEWVGRLDLNNANLDVQIICKGVVFHLRRQGIGGAGGSTTDPSFRPEGSSQNNGYNTEHSFRWEQE